MSYLDVPRMHFAGTFMANPSTINNDASNYNPNAVNSLDLSWNPYGSHAFTIDAKVTSFVDASGQLHTSGDPLIGAAFGSYMPQQIPGKLVDLDTQQQLVTRLFGLNLQLTPNGSTSAALQGLWENGGTLINLWFSRVPSGGGDTAAGGAFQSVLQNIEWGDAGGSQLLGQLQSAAGNGLSVRLTLYGYNDATASPGFRHGAIVGTIGPQLAGEPLHLPPRLLLPAASSPLAWAPAAVNGEINTVTIDLGNSIPDQNPGGPPVDIGTVEAAVLSGTTPTSLGTVDYLGATFQATAGVVQFPITSAQAGQPLAILVAGTPQLAEPANGQYVDVDGSSLYMNPGDQMQATLRATTFGAPAANTTVDLRLVPSADNNRPASALTIPSSVTTGADGSAAIDLSAPTPFPTTQLPRERQNIGGQLYFVGGQWAAGNVQPGPLSVKLFNSIDPPIAAPTWSDVQPILFKYYYLYAYMASIVDLSNYESVKASSQAIRQVLTLPFGDPNYMPVTREMSNDERQLILTWIANGCPPG